jgi:two-component system, NtrC family, nitrogen regulation sensor histidine kinase NtrY
MWFTRDRIRLAAALGGAGGITALLWLKPESFEFRWLAGLAILVFQFTIFRYATRVNEQDMSLIETVLSSFRAGDFHTKIVATASARNGILRQLTELGAELSRRRLATEEASLLAHAIIEHSASIVLISSGDQWLANQLVFANRAAYLEFAPLHAHNREPSAVRAAAAPLINQWIEAGKPSSVRWRSREFSISERRFFLSGRPSRVLIMTDISTALVRTEQSVYSEVFRVFSHEINNAITPIVALSSARALDYGERQEELQISADFERIAVWAKRLSNLVTRSGREFNTPEPDFNSVDLQFVLAEACRALATKWPWVQFRLPPVSQTGMVTADAGHLEQAFLNILKNSCEAASPDRPGIDIKLFRDPSTITVTIRDYGSGLAAEPTYMPTLSGKRDGIGLGLAITRHLLALNHATFELSNAENGKGAIASICFRLPEISGALPE